MSWAKRAVNYYLSFNNKGCQSFVLLWHLGNSRIFKVLAIWILHQSQIMHNHVRILYFLDCWYVAACKPEPVLDIIPIIQHYGNWRYWQDIKGSGFFSWSDILKDLHDWNWGYDYSYKPLFLWYWRLWHVMLWVSHASEIAGEAVAVLWAEGPNIDNIFI